MNKTLYIYIFEVTICDRKLLVITARPLVAFKERICDNLCIFILAFLCHISQLFFH